MTVKFKCAHCGIRLKVADSKAGRTSNCPGCQQPIRIPEMSTQDDSTPSIPQPSSSESKSARIQRVKTAAVAELTEPVPLTQALRPVVADAATEANRSESSRSESSTRWNDRIQMPRWTVYLQAGLLAAVAGTFFVFGVMIGQTSSGRSLPGNTSYPCQLTGEVTYQQTDQRLADEGAVVIVVPADQRLRSRPDLDGLRPDSFKPLENPAIEAVEAIGGRVVRINEQGAFDLKLVGPIDVNVLVISKHASRTGNQPISRSQAADMGRFFFPVEDLLGSKKFVWTKLKLNRESQRLSPVEF